MKQAPRWFVKALERFDPSLRIMFDRSEGLWGIYRRQDAPARGRQCEMPRYECVYLGGNHFALEESYELAFQVTDRQGNYMSLEEVGSLILRLLYEKDSWNRGIRTGQQQLDRNAKRRAEVEREKKEWIQSDAKSIVNIRNIKLDLGARESHNNPAQRYRINKREGRV